MTNSYRAYGSNGDGPGFISTDALREPDSTEVIVRMLTSGISRGTEALVFKGLVPSVESQRMRCPHQQGEFPGPVKYGYCAVGVIEWGPTALIGRRVFCLHPHQDRFIIPIASVCILPDSVPTARAVLAANMETALNALWDLGPRVGDRLAIVGVGVIGALVAALATRMPEVEVQLVDPNPQRAELARIFGCNYVTPDDAIGDVDCIVHASGYAEGLSTAFSIAGFEATILELSWYGSQPISVSLGEHFHSRRLTLRSSQVGSIATVQRSRWDYKRRMQMVMRLLNDDRLDALLDGVSVFDELPQTMARLASGNDGTLCHRIMY
jgi:threonine dehydrogenase-like Zn-dependent dehydrogenase